MSSPPIQYLVSSPYGDITPDENKLDFPLEADTLKTPYRKYFHSIHSFLALEDFQHLLKAARKKLGRTIHLKEVSKIIIRAEKHGLLYHPASIELILQQERAKFCLHVAISDSGKVWLQEETSVLQKLYDTFNLPYLPEVYYCGNHNALFFLLEDWFEGYHEFHITVEGGEKKLKLWEFGKGYTYVSQEQSFELYKQASKILTLYYDLKDFREIYPWHHAAGDFVAKIDDKGTDVRLSTARRYEPIMHFEENINHFLALFYFFLNLCIRMRLDRTDGVGEIIWADEPCIKATITGFFEALHLKEGLDGYPGIAEEFSGLVKSFRKDELIDTIKPILDLYQGSEDLAVIMHNLEDHVKGILSTLQTLPLI